MSEHAWVQEHVAAYLAGGLDAQEAERLEVHARDCPACAELLGDSRRLDDCLSNLFVSVRPTPELEDRTVARLRTADLSWRRVLHPRAKWVGAIAAVLLLGVIGAGAGSLASNDGLLMPGESPVYFYGRAAELEHARAEVRAKNASAESAERARLEAERAALAKFQESLIYDAGDDASDSRTNALRGHGLARGMYGQPNATSTDTTALAIPGTKPDLTRSAMLGYDVSFSGFGPWEYGTHGNKTYIGRAAPPAPMFDPTSQPFDPTSARPTTADPKPSPHAVKHLSGVAPVEPSQPKPEAPAANPKAPTVDPKAAPANPEPARRIVIRSGDMEFEIASFDTATETVTTLVRGIKGAFVATVNSDKLPNGKVKGSITVRVPPDQLDGLVLDLRRELGKGGELKGVKLSSQDITKMYTDLESRLRAARTMEERLLQIIKEGKGEIKQLLEAERELGIWRTKIEEHEGEIRYYANLAAFSTLTVSLTEKEIRAAAEITERERVQAGVEVEDVDKAYQQVLTAVVEAKGRITKSELKQLSAGQFNATFNFEVAAEASGPIRDRLRMLGRVARLEIDRNMQTEGGTLPSDAKTKKGDTLFLVQIYNLANVAPRETATLHVAATDVPAAYQALRDAVAKTTGRVLVSQLNEQDKQNISAELAFEVRRAEEGAARAALEAAGEVLSRQVGRAPESDSVTDSKVLYKVTLLSAARLKPRETTTLSVEVADVDGTATLFAAQVAEAKGRQVDAKLDRSADGKATATLVFEVPLAAAPGLVERFKSAGTVRLSQSHRDPQASEGRYATARLHVTVTNIEAIVPDGGGLWPKVRQGLSLSASVLLTSVTWVVFGLCVVLPWAVVGFGGYRVVRRFVPPAPTPTPVAVPVATPAPTPPAPPAASA